MVTRTATLVTRCGREKTQRKHLPVPLYFSVERVMGHTNSRVFPSSQPDFIACVSCAILPSFSMMCSVIGQLAQWSPCRSRATLAAKVPPSKKETATKLYAPKHTRRYSRSHGGFIHSLTHSANMCGFVIFPAPVCRGARSCYPHHFVFVSQDGS